MEMPGWCRNTHHPDANLDSDEFGSQGANEAKSRGNNWKTFPAKSNAEYAHLFHLNEFLKHITNLDNRCQVHLINSSTAVVDIVDIEEHRKLTPSD